VASFGSESVEIRGGFALVGRFPGTRGTADQTTECCGERQALLNSRSRLGAEEYAPDEDAVTRRKACGASAGGRECRRPTQTARQAQEAQRPANSWTRLIYSHAGQVVGGGPGGVGGGKVDKEKKLTERPAVAGDKNATRQTGERGKQEMCRRLLDPGSAELVAVKGQVRLARGHMRNACTARAWAFVREQAA